MEQDPRPDLPLAKSSFYGEEICIQWGKEAESKPDYRLFPNTKEFQKIQG